MCLSGCRLPRTVGSVICCPAFGSSADRRLTDQPATTGWDRRTLTGEALAALLLLTRFGAATYIVAVCAYQFCWMLWVPLQMAMVAEADVAGRYTVLLTAAQALGVSAGPALAGKLIHGTAYTPVIAIGCGFALAGLALFWPLLLRASGGALSVARG